MATTKAAAKAATIKVVGKVATTKAAVLKVATRGRSQIMAAAKVALEVAEVNLAPAAPRRETATAPEGERKAAARSIDSQNWTRHRSRGLCTRYSDYPLWIKARAGG